MLFGCLKFQVRKKDALILLEQWDQREFAYHRPAPLALAMPPVQILWLADHVFFFDALKPHSYDQLELCHFQALSTQRL